MAQTAHEKRLLATSSLEAFARHYNDRVPTIEEEFDIWGDYHQHRHEMRYDLLADTVRRHLPPGGRVLDVGCGSALVADRLLDVDGHYVGVDFGGHHIGYARDKLADSAASRFGLHRLTPPVRVPALQTNLYWHRRFHRDSGSQWLRALVVARFADAP